MLDALEKLARECGADEEWFTAGAVWAYSQRWIDPDEAAYIAAADPATVLKMIAAIRAAKRVVYSNGFDAALPENIAAAKVALAALEDKK
jgi:hypothetical protein